MNLWDNVLLKLKNEMPPEDYSTWLQPTSYVQHTNECLTIKVPNKLFSTVIRERFYDQISGALSHIGEDRTVIEILDGDETAKKVESFSADKDYDPMLNPRYNFETFVVGKSNELAHAAARAVCAEPGRTYNPLYLYGGVGLGKTHLMQAVGNSIIERHPHLKVAYVTSEYFMNDLINAIRYDRTFQFRNRYRNIDVLLIDDIQFLANKERTQEEFFHTFNTLYNARKQIIISSDCQPRDIPTLEERLRSRFEWGLMADIHSPDLETKIAILHKKAELEKAFVPEEVMMLIASRASSNIRELEGSLIRLVFYSSLTGRPINIELAKEALADLMEPRDKLVTIDKIQQKVAGYFNISTKELVSKNNAARVSFPRQVAMYLCKKLTHSSLPEIGRQFGGKHHSTVLHSLRKIDKLREQDESLETAIRNFIAALS